MIDVKPAHDKQEIELWHDDGVEKMSVAEAENLVTLLNGSLKILANRERPPAPEPFVLEKGDKKPFAQCDQCDGSIGELLCGGWIGGHEFYLKDLVRLRDWLNGVLEYHRREGCKNLKQLESKGNAE